MHIQEAFIISAPKLVLSGLLIDVPEVGMCVPGVRGINSQGENLYEATLAVAIGPIKATFIGTVEVDPSGRPGIIRAKGHGHDKKTNSQVSFDMRAVLEELDGDRTRVSVEADVTIRGRLGQFGTGIIQSTASQMAQAFGECLDDALQGQKSSLTSSTEELSTPQEVHGAPLHADLHRPQYRSISLIRVFLRGMTELLRRWFRRQ